MSHLPIARKYRPQNFLEVIGQPVVVKTLENAITLKRLHPAYLFCGIRGVGKTSLARILAKSLNCETGPTLTPCGVCDACRDITAGISLDVIEIDGASNTGVDDVRELKEGVIYLPQRGRYKMYIIDEVHMLSNSAFNALLKVLEEPPPHVIFCFATTEAHKIPMTVLSRCQKFELRRIALTDCVAQLRTICDAENVSYDDESLVRLAQLGDGSLRDSLSLLDQAIGMSDRRVTRDALDEWLGFSHRDLIRGVFEAVLSQDFSAVLDALSRLKTLSIDPEHALTAFIEWVRHAILIRAGASARELPELGPVDYEALRAAVANVSPHELDWLFQLATRGLQDLSLSALPFYTLEVLFIRFARARELRALTGASVNTAHPSAAKPAVKPSAPSTADVRAPSPLHATREPSAVPAPKAPQKAPAQAGQAGIDWRGFVDHLRTREPQLGAPLAYVKWQLTGDELVLSPDGAPIYIDMLASKLDRLSREATDFFKQKITVRVKNAASTGDSSDLSVMRLEREEGEHRQKEAEKAAAENTTLKKLTAIFGGTIEEVKPLGK